MIIKNGEVFQEDGSFRLQDLYVENHRIVASEDEVMEAFWNRQFISMTIVW